MQKNEGNIDRIARAVVAVVAVILAIVLGGGWAIVFGVVAAIMAVTAAVGFCPLYRVFGMNTCKTKSA